MSDATPQAGNLRGAVDLSSLVEKNSGTQGGTPAGTGDAGAPEGGLVFEGTDANFTHYLELSSRVPIVVDLWAEWCGPCKQLTPVLHRLVEEYAGRLGLVTVDVDANPQLAQAFQAQSIPTVVALVGGRPVTLFTGAVPEEQVREVFDQLLELAAQNGVTGTLEVDGAQAADDAEAEPSEEPLPPHHQEAYDAIERGDYEAAIRAYKAALAENPRDEQAEAGLAQVALISRLQGHSLDEVRSRAAEAPADADAQLLVADLDLSGGHVEDAFDRLLALFPSLTPEDKDRVRTRLLDHFRIVGAADPRVAKARARLASLLY